MKPKLVISRSEATRDLVLEGQDFSSAKVRWRTRNDVAALGFRVRPLLVLFLLLSLSSHAYAAESYSRYEADPFEKYSFGETMKRVNAIRAEGHPIPVGHPRIFITPSNRAALAQQIATHHSAWMQELVNLADANFGKVITDPGNPYDEPDGQPVILANALIYQLGLLPGVTYQHTRQEYGQEGVRHLLDMAAIDTQYGWFSFEYLALPLGYDWLHELMTDGQRRTVATKLLAYAQPGSPQIESRNSPTGADLLGPLAMLGDGIDDDEARRLLDLFHNGYVFSDRSRFYGDPTFASVVVITPEGPGPESLGYSGWYNQFYPILLAWRDQTGEDYFKLPYLQNWPLAFTHTTGNEYEHQQQWQYRYNEPWRQGGNNYTQTFSLMEMGLAPSNPGAASLVKHHLSKSIGILSQSVRVLHMLLADPALPARSPAELNLPTTAHFESVNHVFGRSSWEGTDATWLWFAGPTWNTRAIGALNELIIWKNGGMLLPKHYVYHDYEGGNRTNTLTLYDDAQPGKTFIPQNVMDDARSYYLGLPGWEPNGFSLRDLNKELWGYHEGLRFFEERPGEYLYAFGDGGQVFQATELPGGRPGEGTLTLPAWSRELLWFPASSSDQPDYFFVFDRVNTGKDTVHPFVPLHFNMEPLIRDRATDADLGPGVLDEASNRFPRATINATTFYSLVEYATDATLELKDPQAPNNPLSAFVVGNAVTVLLGTDASGKIITTNAAVSNLINTDTATKNLMRAYYPAWPYDSHPTTPTHGPVLLVGGKGIWRYEGADRIVATNTVTTGWGKAHGRLFADTLLPADPIYYRTGGVVERNIDRFGNLQVIGTGSEEPVIDGMWRVEVGDPVPGADQTFLHVLQATDSTIETPDATTLLESPNLVGAAVANNIALFNREEAVLTNGSVVVPAGVSGTYRLLLADLKPYGSYDLTVGGTVSRQTASKTGTLYLSSVALAPGDTIALSLVGSAVTCGDLNKDGKVDIADAVLLAQIIVGSKPPPQPPCLADLNSDGQINVVDLVLLIKHILGQVAKLSCCGG